MLKTIVFHTRTKQNDSRRLLVETDLKDSGNDMERSSLALTPVVALWGSASGLSICRSGPACLPF
jgi:hypothetical protein